MTESRKFGLIRQLISIVGALSAAVLGALVLLIVFDATRRYLFHEGSVALQELEWHLFDVVIMLGVAYAMHRGAHVRVDIFYDRFSERTKQVVNVVTMLFFVLPVSALILYVSFDFVLMSFAQMEASSDPGGLPYRFVVKALIPLAFALLILQAIRELAEAWHALKESM
ncbi:MULTISPECIES: TRAP transporter small permease subunit [Sulfurimonas]|uniref:TRAP transporter small permease subunit n=1 Tax=Sulfurimonas diazotrophicus TaxID=3131939 RepID=A0ABZ3HCY2_9BACT